MRALLVAVSLIVPASALAQADGRGYGPTYAQMRLGAAIPEHDDLDGFDTGLAFDLGLGTFLTPNLAFEAGIGRFKVTAEDQFFDPTIGATVTGKLAMSAVPFTASLKIGSALGGRGFVYGLAGVGLYMVSMEARFSAPGFLPIEDDDSATAFGFHFGAGVDAEIAPRWTVAGEVRYVASKVEVLDVTGNINSVIVTGGVGYRF